MTDLHEASRQYVHQEATDKLDGGDGHELLRVSIRRIAPSKCNLVVGETHQTSISDGDPVRVARQILQHMFRASERAFCVDHPFLLFQITIETIKSCRPQEFGKFTGKPELSAAVKGGEQLEESVSEAACENVLGKEETSAASDPARAVHRQSAGWNQTVQVRVMEHFLIPGVQHGEESQLGAQSFGIGSD